MTVATVEVRPTSNVSITPQLTVSGHVARDTEIEIVDVVGGRHMHTVGDLVALHLDLFPGYGFVAAEIVADAAAPPERDSLIVHQWLVIRAGRAAGLMLFDINVARRVALIHFLGIERSARHVRLGGERLATWMCRRVRDTLTAELAEHAPRAVPLGVFGESTDRLVRRWLGAGFHRVDLPYAEPVSGRRWRALGDRSMRPINLLRLPMRDADDASFGAGTAGAAAFLLDHYELPIDHPTVVAATGDEVRRPGGCR